MWFHWCYCFLFSVLFSFALLLLSLHILPFMAFLFFGFFIFYQVLFHGCVFFQGHLSPLSAAFSGCFFGLFCPVLLDGWFLARRRAPIFSSWFFIWYSLRPPSTSFLFVIIVVFVLIDTNWLGSFFFWVLLFTDCASVFHPAFLLSGSVLSSGL